MDSWDLFEPTNVLSKLPATFETDLDSKKWMERKQALEALLQLLQENPRLATNVHYDDIVERLKTFLDKDANINVTATAAKCITGLANGLRAKFSNHSRTVVPVIFEKFKEKKPLLRDALIECIDAVYATTNLEAIADEITKAAGKPNPNIKIQLDSFLYRVFKNLNAKSVPKSFLKEFIPILIKHANDPDPDVRDAASSALGAIMKCVGQNAANIMFGPFSGDKLKMAKVEEFFTKATEEAEQEAKLKQERAPAVGASSNSATSSTQPATCATTTTTTVHVEEQIDTWELFEPVDVLPKLPASFRTDLESKKWLERKTALESLLQLLTDNPRLCHKAHYGDIVQTLNTVLDKDSNINVASVAAKSLTCVAKGLRKHFSSHVRTVVPTIFAKFKEKKATLRDPLVECIDAVYATTTLEVISEDILEAAKKPNPDIKIQLDLFIYRCVKHLNASELPKKLLKEFTPVLIKHTGDSDPEVRNSSCSALGAIMKCIGQKPALILFGDLAQDKLKMSKIEEFYNKALADAGQEVVSAMVQSVHKADKVVEKPPKKPSTEKPPSKEAQNEANDESLKPKRKDANAEEGEDEVVVETKPKTGAPKPPPEEKPKEQEEVASLLKVSSDRTGRAKDEKAHKLMKWNFEMPTAEHTQQLNTQIGDVAKPALSAQLLSKDFKQHIKAIDYLQQLLTIEPAAIVNNIDIILRWGTLRFFDTNPAVLIRLLEFICSVFVHMDSESENLTDLEMTAFLPYLLLKSGDAKEVIRNNVRKIVKLMGGISVPGKIFPLLLDGLKTKNSRQKAECIIIVDSFLECMGINITSTPQQTMKVLASCISDRDSSVRNAALNAIVTVYKKIGDRVFPLIGQLNEKEKAMLDERIKRSGHLVSGAPESESRPSTMKERLNATLNVTPRARSSSATRRSLNVMNGGEGMNAENVGMTAVVPLNATISKSSSAGRHRQSMGALSKFQLDPKFFNNDIDLGVDTTMAMGVGGGRPAPFTGIQLDNDTDLKGIQPVVRPTTNAHFGKRSESVSSISSLESAEQIDRTVHNLSCLQLSIADEAIAQLLHLLHDSMNRVYIMERSELILKTFITQFFHIRSQHFEQLEAGGDGTELSEFMRSVCNFLSSLVKDDAIVQQLSSDTMRAFVDALLCLVTDERLNILPGCRQIFRSLNVVVIRICEFSNPNNCFVALMKLLIKYQGTEPNGRVIALIRKCLYKHVDVFLDTSKLDQLDLNTVFELLFSYYSKYYTDPANITDSVKETCRTLHVYIQRLVVTTRYKVLNYLYPYPENSPLVTYIRRCVRALGKSEQTKNLDETAATVTADGETTMVQSHKVIPEEMVQLFKRINDEDIFDGCVEELYNFMDVHPEQNGNFEELMSSCPYSCVVRRAFVELRQSRLRKEPLAAGECVRLVLPKEDRDFIHHQYAMQKRFKEAFSAYGGQSPSAQAVAAGGPKAT